MNTKTVGIGYQALNTSTNGSLTAIGYQSLNTPNQSTFSTTLGHQPINQPVNLVPYKATLGGNFGKSSVNFCEGFDLTFESEEPRISFKRDDTTYDLIHMFFSLQNENKKLIQLIQEMDKRLIRVESAPFGVDCMDMLKEEKRDGVLFQQ